jgi:hypothetical protein
MATATEAQQAAARVAADDAAAATVAAVQQHTHRHARQQQRGQKAPPALLAPGVFDPTGLSVADVFSLSSRPESKYKLVLDFNGNVLTGSAWNDVKKVDKIVTPPYDKGKSCQRVLIRPACCSDWESC